MQQKTLDLVGRKHTVQDVKDIFHAARELGFDNINMDLIMGASGRGSCGCAKYDGDFKRTRSGYITIHSLAIKPCGTVKHFQGSL